MISIMFYSKYNEIALWENAVNCIVTNNALIKTNDVLFSCIDVLISLMLIKAALLWSRNTLRILWNIILQFKYYNLK